jgi:hypothetical protein
VAVGPASFGSDLESEPVGARSELRTRGLAMAASGRWKPSRTASTFKYVLAAWNDSHVLRKSVNENRSAAKFPNRQTQEEFEKTSP